MAIDLAKEEIPHSVNKMRWVFLVKIPLISWNKKDLVTITKINAFQEGAQRFIIPMLAKLFEKSALGSTVLRSASLFDPTLMFDLPKEKL